MPETNDINEIYAEYKLVKQKYEALQHDYSEGLLKKEANDEAIKKQQDTLTAILNQISGEKLAWAQEKAQGERELKEKKAEIDKILARAKELDAKEANLVKRELDIAEKLKQDNTILLEVKSEKTANNVIIREAEDKVKSAEKIKEQNIKLIQDFKLKIDKINQEIQKL